MINTISIILAVLLIAALHRIHVLEKELAQAIDNLEHVEGAYWEREKP